MASIPIWKDYFVTIGTSAKYYVRVRTGGTTIYQGIAYKKPGAVNVVVKVNDVIADYLAMVAPGVPYGNQTAKYFPVQFQVQSSTNGSSWNTKSTIDIDWDWSFKTGVDLSTNGMAYPITGRITNNMMLYQTRYASGTPTTTAYYGSTTRSITPSVDSSISGSGAFFDMLRFAGSRTAYLNTNTYAVYSSKDLTKIVMGGVTYEVSKKCPKYCLYYLNPFGGVDHLLLEGNCRKNRSVKRETFVADYDNSEPTREEFNYMNEITESYTMNTGLLTDDESSRMPYLLDSVQVYLVDLAAPTTFIPVTINTDNYTVQEYKSNGNRLVNYTFDVKVSQNEYRR